MKTMILIETAEERAKVEKIWSQIKALVAEGAEYPTECDLIENAVVTHDAGSTDLLFGEGGAIVYDHRTEDGDPVWHIYNFNTLKEETVEGDLAGLANAEDGNFPLF